MQITEFDLKPLGVSFRNTKRFFRKKFKMTAVGELGPQLPVNVLPIIEQKDPQAHVHPRRYRDELCGCGFPARPCTFLDDDTRNYCFKRMEADAMHSS